MVPIMHTANVAVKYGILTSMAIITSIVSICGVFVGLTFLFAIDNIFNSLVRNHINVKYSHKILSKNCMLKMLFK